ncbi:MAG: TIGR02679 domain-containing protein, partial [Actinomycetota bacterium]
MKPSATSGIVELLSVPELRRVFEGARRRLEQSASLSASFAIGDPDDAERRAIGRLLGTRPPTGRAVRISLERLDAALTSSRFGIGLVEALELVGGPIWDRGAARLAAAKEKEALWKGLTEHPAVRARPELARWLDSLRSSGIASRLAGARESELVSAALEIVGSLPRSGDRLNVVAAAATGDAHALDRGTPLGSMV